LVVKRSSAKPPLASTPAKTLKEPWKRSLPKGSPKSAATACTPAPSRSTSARR